jgi:hypothetical protein
VPVHSLRAARALCTVGKPHARKCLQWMRWRIEALTPVDSASGADHSTSDPCQHMGKSSSSLWGIPTFETSPVWCGVGHPPASSDDVGGTLPVS